MKLLCVHVRLLNRASASATLEKVFSKNFYQKRVGRFYNQENRFGVRAVSRPHQVVRSFFFAESYLTEKDLHTKYWVRRTNRRFSKFYFKKSYTFS